MIVEYLHLKMHSKVAAFTDASVMCSPLLCVAVWQLLLLHSVPLVNIFTFGFFSKWNLYLVHHSVFFLITFVAVCNHGECTCISKQSILFTIQFLFLSYLSQFVIMGSEEGRENERWRESSLSTRPSSLFGKKDGDCGQEGESGGLRKQLGTDSLPAWWIHKLPH